MSVRETTQITDRSHAKNFFAERQFHLQHAKKERFVEDGAFLIIDIRGRIIECSDAAAVLLGYSYDGLHGRLISQVIPKLPFAMDTPYYNLAYAVFHADKDFKMDRLAVSGNGEVVPVDVFVSSVVVKGRRLILLNLMAAKSRELM